MLEDEKQPRGAPIDQETASSQTGHNPQGEKPGQSAPKKQRATKQKDVSAQWGKPAWEYSDGSIRDARGHSLARIPGGAELITAETAPALARLRAQKTQQAIQDAIVNATGGMADVPAELRAPAAVGAAAGILWGDIVLRAKDRNGNVAYARDRLQAWDTISNRAGLAEQRQQDHGSSQPVTVNVLFASVAADLLAEGEVTEAEIADDHPPTSR